MATTGGSSPIRTDAEREAGGDSLRSNGGRRVRLDAPMRCRRRPESQRQAVAVPVAGLSPAGVTPTPYPGKETSRQPVSVLWPISHR